ncbi:AAA family ATPase [Halorubrum ezzemoulense]|uniref:AAA family ATPase n=1 Tax=Halorubrum ezzemoulense TaxID=337243 RepID=UPI002330AA1E|nr:AAA family ATPase [Halorubrum ezzemoulense]MDB9235216.1 AAA family ATPase [Halorubrum ezzemoulense]
MELITLQLQNFRQFYGEQSIRFSTDQDQNVTVIHGSNGSGKTTLLNAFTWLFYDNISLPKPDKLVSERAVAEVNPGNSVTVSVSLEFEHEGTEYEATRVKEFSKREGISAVEQSSEIRLEFTDEHGNLKTRSNPGTMLNRIMPERLKEIFFFDGETIDELSAIDGQEKIQEAIRNIMGLSILERSTRHLEHAVEKYEQIAQEQGSEELSNLISEKQDITQEITTKEDTLESHRLSKSETEDEVSDIEDRLSQLEGSRELQKERDELEEELADVDSDIEAINDDIAREISERGFLPFAMPAVEETGKMLQKKREKGEIPSDIKTHFVDDLLELNECICGRPLKKGTDPYEEVKGWRERAGSTEIEETAMSIVGRLSELGGDQEKLYSEIERHLSRRAQKADKKQEIQERLDEISSQLSDEEQESIADLESRRSNLLGKIGEYEEKIRNLNSEIEELKDKRKALEDEIAEAKEENEKAQLARKRAQTAAYLQSQISTLFQQYQNEVRQNVNERVNEIFQDIIAKNYYAKISDDHTLQILKDVGETSEIPVAQSQGERQVASLSFIATLISLARERYESDEDATYFKGGIYPMIMDSPFGSLDPTYQERVSRMLPEMAQQVVVMVTQAQWSEEVASEMEHVAGERYYLDYHDPGEDPDTNYEHTDLVRKTGGDY